MCVHLCSARTVDSYFRKVTRRILILVKAVASRLQDLP